MLTNQQSQHPGGDLCAAEKGVLAVIAVAVVATIGGALTALLLKLEPDAGTLAQPPAGSAAAARTAALPRPDDTTFTYQ